MVKGLDTFIKFRKKKVVGEEQKGNKGKQVEKLHNTVKSGGMELEKEDVYADVSKEELKEEIKKYEQKMELYVESINKLCSENEMLWVQDEKRKAELVAKNDVLRFYSTAQNYVDTNKGYNAIKVDEGLRAKLILDVYGINVKGIEKADSITNRIRKR